MSQPPKEDPSPQRRSPVQRRRAHMDAQERAQWSSEPAFVFSMAAAAVGLGNLWRFPYMAGENGGGAFILAYLVAVLVVGLPLMMLEIASGRLAHGSTVGTFRGVTRAGTIYGWFIVALTAVISSYYLVITGWTMGYAVLSVASLPPTFPDFTNGLASLWWFLAVTALCAGILLRGMAAIERFSKVLIPLLIVVVVALVLRGVGGAGWSEAVDFLFTWNAEALGRADLWLYATGQAFFTLALGQGYLVTYGSYIPQRTHVPRASFIVLAVQVFVAIMAGLMLFPLVFAQGGDPGEGSQMAFVALPRAFADMAWGRFLAPVFFWLFFAAALSSCLAGLKVVVAAIAEEFRMSNRRAVLLTCAVMALLGTPSALSFSVVDLSVAGMPVLNLVDRIGGTNVVLVSTVIGAGLLCWSIAPARISRGLGSEARWFSLRVRVIGRAAPLIGLALWGWQVMSG